MKDIEGIDIYISAGHYKTDIDGYGSIVPVYVERIEVTSRGIGTMEPGVEKEILSRVHYALKDISRNHMIMTESDRRRKETGGEDVADTRYVGA